MAKDPAFLFYYQDFLVGTEFMTIEETGIYIKMLCHLADKGRLSKQHMQSICKAYEFTELLQSKFKIDEEGYFYNERLREEVEKRRKYAESRRNNAKGEKAYAKHMENENIDENISFKEEELINNIWINVFLYNPGLVEKTFIKELLNKYGEKKTKKIMYDFRENGFRKISTMRNALDEEGNIKSKEENKTVQEI